MSDWIAQHFLHPSFVLPWGAALMAVPVIVHLINRLRYRRVRFAAMQFLLQSQQRNRRRLLIEQLLLLLLRVAIVAGLLALISRLVMDASALWVFHGAKSHHVVLLDDSESLRDRWGETSAFREGLTTVQRLASAGAQRPGTQQLTLLLLSRPERPIFLKRDVNNAFLVELETAFESLQCTHQALDLVNGLEAADKLLAEDPGSIRHLHVISDFRTVDWQERPALRNAFVAISKRGVSIDLARTVAESHDNLAITDLGGEVRTAAAGVPVRLSATVRNFGTKMAEHVRLAILEDGNLLPLTVDIERLEAGQEQRRDFDVIFKQPGKHAIEIQLPEDALPADNRRFVALDIQVANSILIIEGNPENDDASYIATALAPEPSLTGFLTRIEAPDFLRRESLDAFRCIYLLNVPQLPDDAVQILADYVRRGGGLVWFLGDVVNTSFYNDALYGKAGGLFPVPLESASRTMTRSDEQSPAPDLSFTNHPIFRIFEGQNNPFVDTVRMNTWIPVAKSWNRDDNRRKDQVATIATLPGKEPFALSRQFGKGRILAFLTSAGPKWNDWVKNPSFVVLQLELAKFLAREEQTLQPKTVGEPIEVTLNPAEFLETVEITAPDVNGKRMTRLKATQSPAPQNKTSQETSTKNDIHIAPAAGKSKDRSESIRLTAMFAETDQPGMYVVRTFKDQAAVPQERWVAYNVAVAESNLKTATTAEILARLSNDVHAQIHEPGAFQWIEGHSSAQESRMLLLSFLAVALVAEQFFAYRLSYHPASSSRSAA